MCAWCVAGTKQAAHRAAEQRFPAGVGGLGSGAPRVFLCRFEHCEDVELQRVQQATEEVQGRPTAAQAVHHHVTQTSDSDTRVFA